MFQILLGIVIGTAVTLAALNPSDAKQLVSKSVDAIHSGYTATAKSFNEPIKMEIPPIPEVAESATKNIKNAFKE